MDRVRSLSVSLPHLSRRKSQTLCCSTVFQRLTFLLRRALFVRVALHSATFTRCYCFHFHFHFIVINVTIIASSQSRWWWSCGLQLFATQMIIKPNLISHVSLLSYLFLFVRSTAVFRFVTSIIFIFILFCTSLTPTPTSSASATSSSRATISSCQMLHTHTAGRSSRWLLLA